MDLVQFLTIIGTIAASYYMIRRDIKMDMIQMQTIHREDIQRMDAAIIRMDEKWEKLFSLFVQDKIDSANKGE